MTPDSCRRLDPTQDVGNLAVPGARVADLLGRAAASVASRDPGLAALYHLVLGPNDTQVSAALKARPDFLTIWIGTNDWLGSLRPDAGAAPMTPPATFEAQYRAVLKALASATRRARVVLITVPGPAQFPILMSSATVAGLGVGTEDCRTSPNTVNGFAVLPLLGSGRKLSCVAGPGVLTPTRLGNVQRTVDAYKASIRRLAAERGFRVFELASLETGWQRHEFDPAKPAAPFGADLSLDGLHFSSQGYARLARGLAAFVNRAFGLSVRTN